MSSRATINQNTPTHTWAPRHNTAPYSGSATANAEENQ